MTFRKINKMTFRKINKMTFRKINKNGLKLIKISKNDVTYCVNFTAWQCSHFDFNCRHYPIILNFTVLP